MRGSRGPRGFPRTVTRQYLGPWGSNTYDLPHRGVLRDTVIAYDGTTVLTATLSRGTGTGGADQLVFPGPTGFDTYATYSYIPGYRGEG